MKKIILFICIFLIAGSQLYSQPQRMQRGGFDRINTLMQVRLIEVLELDEETSARFMVIYNENNRKHRELAMQVNSLIDSLDVLLRNGADERYIQEIIENINRHRAEMHNHRTEAYKRYGELLNTTQMAQLLVFERKFNRELQFRLRDVMRERRGMR